MIFGKDGFVRTRPYGRSRICLKARKYRRFGGFKRNHLWLTTIGDYAFSGCELRGIITPNSVTSIGRGTFDNCSSLKTVFYKGTAEQWNRIEIIRTDICLIMATRYYYSESEPTNYGNFWHYDADGVTPVIW